MVSEGETIKKEKLQNGIDVIHKPTKAKIRKYEEGLEDGFATITDVITNAHIYSDNLIQIERDGKVLCPYISQRRGRTFINKDDYIVFEENGSKHVISDENLWNRFERLNNH